MTKNILVTGGTGYIGSHTCIELIKAGYNPIIYDNFSNSSPKAAKRIEEITGKSVVLEEGDIRNKERLVEVIKKYDCKSVIHFAGLKAVGESCEQPLKYYDNNICGSLRLLEAMVETNLLYIVFSSSCTVYGEPQFLPLTETHPLSTINPYGHTKLVIEGMIENFTTANPKFKSAILRYFNPTGADKSGKIGEDPRIMGNLMPFITQAAIGKREFVNVYRNNYDTKDGTGVRDYIHVVDLAKAHIKALEAIINKQENILVNVGTGKGYSVLEVIETFEKASGKKINYKICERRAGDSAASYADTTKAEKVLGWKAEQDLFEMCEDSFRWQSQNPNGFE